MSLGLKDSKSLKQLGLSNNRISDVGAQELTKNLSHCIDITKNRLSPAGVKILADIIDQDTIDFSCSNIAGKYLTKRSRSISLQYNNISAVSLGYCSKLETLYLDHNQIGNDGAEVLASGLKNCNNLEVLKLADNLIGSEGAKALGQGLKHCKKFRILVYAG